MRGHGLAGPVGAGFLGRVVADGEDEVHLGRGGCGELVPGFAAQAGGGYVRKVKLVQRLGPDRAGGMAAGTVGSKNAPALAIQDGLSQNGPRGVPGAEKEDVVVVGHDGAPTSAPAPQQPGAQQES